MMTTLAIVGCGPRLEVALRIRGVSETGLVALAGTTPRSDLIMAAVELLARAAGIEPAGIEAVAATRGPGSFTGIRVALATARGLATALSIPGCGVGSLLIQATRAMESPCLAAQPARRGHLYVQEFRRDHSGVLPVPAGEIRPMPAEEVGAIGLPVVAPSGVVLPEDVRRATPRISTAEALLEVADLIATPDAETLVPLYLEPPPAVPPRRTAKPWPPSPTTS